MPVYSFCLYAYTIKNKNTLEPTGFKVGITTLRKKIKDEYKAIEERIKSECIHNIKSRHKEEFVAGDIFFCIRLDAKDPLYDKITFNRLTSKNERDEEYFKKRCRYYEKQVHLFLKKNGFHRTDMYKLNSDGSESKKTEFFYMVNSVGDCVKYAMDEILGCHNLNIDTHFERWYHCVGCDDYAKEDDGQICDKCKEENTWCHSKCADSYKERNPNIVYDYDYVKGKKKENSYVTYAVIRIVNQKGSLQKID
uniref:Uncharacterized protein n=1 Tax=viral metagenome TaxID=1070528 RepID=A0A6C0JGA3_9ZZZZ